MSTDELAEAQDLLQRVTPPRYWQQASRESGFRRSGIFSLPVVIWMMITQRLEPGGTLARAVQQLRRGGGRKLLRPCQRVREGRISAATGGYCQARQKLSTLKLRRIVDDLFERLQAVLRPTQASAEPVFVLDGSTLLLENSRDLPVLYPPAQNQYGRTHRPVLRMAVAHDADSGLAVRPAWGAAFGPQAVSEQHLIQDVLQRLPSGALVLGDRNFGVFSVAWAACEQGHPVLLRLTNARARNLLGGSLESSVDREAVWRPSAYERRVHPELPPGIALTGRVLVCPWQGAREPLLCLFTTTDKLPRELAALYSLRWNIETDLRALKRIVQLHHLHARSDDMMEKEWLSALLAYNLVRTVMCLAARKAGFSPRQLSFTAVYSLVELHLPALLNACSPAQWRREMDTLVVYAAAYKLPQRRKPRSCPRAVWGADYRFPFRTHEKTK